MKMGFDAPACEMDQQSGHQQLPRRNDMAGPCFARLYPGQEEGIERDRAAQKQSRPDMEVGLTGRPGPGTGREIEGGGDSDQPLERHQAREHPVGAPKDALLVLGKESIRLSRYHFLYSDLLVCLYHG